MREKLPSSFGQLENGRVGVVRADAALESHKYLFQTQKSRSMMSGGQKFNCDGKSYFTTRSTPHSAQVEIEQSRLLLEQPADEDRRILFTTGA